VSQIFPTVQKNYLSTFIVKTQGFITVKCAAVLGQQTKKRTKRITEYVGTPLGSRSFYGKIRHFENDPNLSQSRIFGGIKRFRRLARALNAVKLILRTTFTYSIGTKWF